VIADLLPATVAAAEVIGPEPDPGPGLFPAEEALVRTAGPRRRAEFTAGRAMARQALAGLGLPATPIPAGRAGEPRWPAGVTGSITHCAGYRACAVAWTADMAALGIDAEPDAGLPAGLIESVAGDAERAWIARQAAGGAAASGPRAGGAAVHGQKGCGVAVGHAVNWDRLLFSAKEAVGKLWYPVGGQWPGLRGVTVFPAGDGTFEAEVAGRCLTGRWVARDGLIVTAAWLAGR
jgi:4'-phosphopantetheinyl transferase EntD